MDGPKYAVGDTVVIRDRDFLKTQRNVYPSCVPDMQILGGTETTITESWGSVHCGEQLWLYNIDADDGCCSWLEDWFQDPEVSISSQVLVQFNDLL